MESGKSILSIRATVGFFVQVRLGLYPETVNLLL
jgi:hypothetical protein